MPLLAMTLDGVLYETDSTRSDGRGFGRASANADASSVVLSDPNATRARGKLLERREQKQLAKRLIKREYKRARDNEYAKLDEQVRAANEAAHYPKETRQAIMAGEVVVKQLGRNADFDQYERVCDAKDYAQLSGRADFQNYGLVNNPLTPDGSYGSVTDFDRYVKGQRFDQPVKYTPPRLFAQNMGSWLSDVTGINLEADDKAEQSLFDQGTQYLEKMIAPAPAPAASAPRTSIVRLPTLPAMPATVTLPGGFAVSTKTLMIAGGSIMLLIAVGLFLRSRK